MTLNPRRVLIRQINTFFQREFYGVVPPGSLKFSEPQRLEFANRSQRKNRTVHSKIHESVIVSWDMQNGPYSIELHSRDEMPPDGLLRVRTPFDEAEGPIGTATWSAVADAIRSALRHEAQPEGILSWEKMTIRT